MQKCHARVQAVRKSEKSYSFMCGNDVGALKEALNISQHLDLRRFWGRVVTLVTLVTVVTLMTVVTPMMKRVREEPQHGGSIATRTERRCVRSRAPLPHRTSP